jgi:hypothetical protein
MTLLLTNVLERSLERLLLALSLLVARILANDPHNAAALHDLALFTNLLH